MAKPNQILRILPWRTWQAIFVVVSIAVPLYKWNLDCSVWGSAWTGNLPRLARSIAYGGNPDASWQGESAMGGAFWHEHPASGLFLLYHGADPNRVLPNTVSRIDISVLNELVSHGLKVRGPWGNRALFVAVRAGRVDLVLALLRLGANPRAYDVEYGTVTQDTVWKAAHEPESLTCADSPKILAALIAVGAKR